MKWRRHEVALSFHAVLIGLLYDPNPSANFVSVGREVNMVYLILKTMDLL
jgi:hypothetical protein